MYNSTEICVKEINAAKVNDRKFKDRGQESSRIRGLAPNTHETRLSLLE